MRCLYEVGVLIALFTNMRILKLKRQLTIAFFAALNVIGKFRSVLCVSVFQGSLLVIVIMIDGSEKRNCQGGF